MATNIPHSATPDLPDYGTDNLLGALLFVCNFFHKPAMGTTLTAGLPLNKNHLTPQLFVRAAARAGFEARMVERKLNDLSEHTFPIIAFLDDNYPVVIISKTTGNHYDIFDPGNTQNKRLTISAERLGNHHSGNVFLIRPASQFELKREVETDGTKWFWGTLKQFKSIYIQVALAAVIINLFGVVNPLFVMNVYDRVVPNAAYETLWVLAGGAFLAFLFEFLLRQLRDYFLDIAGRGADVMLSAQLFQQVMNIRLGKQANSAGTTANQLREFETLREFCTSATLTTLIDLPFALMFVLFIAILGGPLALVPLLVIPVVLLAGFVLQLPLRSIMFQAAQDMDAKHGHLIETLTGLETIKTTNAQSHMQSRWEYLTGVMARMGLKSRFITSLGMNLTGFLQQMVTIIIVVWGVYLIHDGNMTMGALVACTILSGRAMAPVAQAMGLFIKFHQARTSLMSLNMIMQASVERPEGKNYLHTKGLKGGVEFQNVSFSYPDAPQDSLKNISLNIKPGERVAIVGRTGSGKSTITRLLIGLFEPTSGHVLLDGIDMRQLDPAEYRQHIGYVAQQVHLFKGTLRENITMAKPNAPAENLATASQMTGMDSLAANHPLGLNMPLGEDGGNLSGGQRQAVTVARAVFPAPQLLVLDEPTSDMDAQTESTLINNLHRWMENRTLVVVTHRPALLQLVDRLVVMDSGKIVADGPKDVVIERLNEGKIKGSI